MDTLNTQPKGRLAGGKNTPLGKPNASRDKWPNPRPDKNGNFSQAKQEDTRDVEVCYNLVKIASGIMGRPLRLHMGSTKQGVLRAATDGKNIFIPTTHPNRRVVTKHELSHIYFKSNIPLRFLFVRELITLLEKESKQTFPQYLKNNLTDDLAFLINILDDIRVNSLWGLLYPGDGEDMEEWYQGTVAPQMYERYADKDIDHLFTYAILLCLDQPATSSLWGEFEEDITQARDDVLYKSFNASLLVVKQLVYKIAKRLITKKEEEEEQETDEDEQGNPLDQDPSNEDQEQADQMATGHEDDGGDYSENDDVDQQVQKKGAQKRKEENKEKALEQAVKQMTQGEKPGDDFSNDNAGFDHDREVQVTPRQEKLLKAQLRALDNIDLEDEEEYEKALGRQEDAGSDLVAQIQKALNNQDKPAGNAYITGDSYLRKYVKAAVRFVRVTRGEIQPAGLTRNDIDEANRWNKYFRRVMGTLAMKTEAAGAELLPDLYIQQKLASEPFACFRHDTAGRGFRVNILVDMSSSMSGTFPKVARLCAMLVRALDFPFVHLEVMGFNTTEWGQVNIYQFPKNTQGLLSARSQVTGATPLSHAIQIAGRTLVGSKDDAHVFVIGDGFPTYATKKHWIVDTPTLINWTRDAVLEMRKRQVKVWCFMIGDYVPPEEDMTKMFGPKNWRKIREDQLYADSFSFIVDRFMKFVRSR